MDKEARRSEGTVLDQGKKVLVVGDAIDDVADVAPLVELLGLVITIDNLVAHLPRHHDGHFFTLSVKDHHCLADVFSSVLNR